MACTPPGAEINKSGRKGHVASAPRVRAAFILTSYDPDRTAFSSLERARGENARSMKRQKAHFQSEKSGWTRLKGSSPNGDVVFFFISCFSLEMIIMIDRLFASLRAPFI
jgi:hypothetical protein